MMYFSSRVKFNFGFSRSVFPLSIKAEASISEQQRRFRCARTSIPGRPISSSELLATLWARSSAHGVFVPSDELTHPTAAYLMTRRTSREVECYSEDEDVGAVRPEQAVPAVEAELTTMEAGPSHEDAIDFEHGVTKKWHIPDMLKGGAPVKLGIDEAGRGPVLGPMVYAAAFWKVEDDAAMCALGFNDSKALDDKHRQRLFKRMRNTLGLGWIIHCLHASELSGKMLRREPCSLNIVSHDAAAELVSLALAEGVCVTEVYVDTVGDPEMYQRKLEGLFEHHTPKIKMTVSKKADSLFKTVSAASIAAKVTRDRVLATWAWEEVFAGGTMPQRDFGSGYPSDPRAAEWMKHNSDPVFGYTSLVRFSWSTAREHMEKQCVSVQWDAEADDLTLPIGTASIESFLRPKPGVKRGRKRAKFFESRGLALVSDM